MLGQSIAQYKIISKLGAGGMGVVYLAEDGRLGRRVALKVLPAEFGGQSDRVARFEREARAVAALSHPGIAVLYEMGETDGLHYLAMEYIEGRTLQEELAETPIAMERLADYVTQIGEALAHAHKKSVLHRDIKPANIMVTPEGRVKLLDFGLAKLMVADDAARTELTGPNMWMGTLSYCAPEVLRGYEADVLSDLYSFGVVIYQMACGKPPFEGMRGNTLVSAILSGQARPPSVANPLLSAPLHNFLMRAIAAERDRRPRNVAELCKAFNDALAGGASAPPVAQALPVVAVLDFQNLADDHYSDWLATGLAETVSSDLKRAKLVRVLPRERVQEAARRHRSADGSQFQSEKLGQELGARWLVMGSYQRAGARLRILPKVLEISTGEEIVTPKIDGQWDDVFTLQDRVVTDLLAALDLNLGSSAMERIAAPETLHLEAYEQYAQGRQQFYQIGKESLERARQYLERAVALDPNYALAYAALGATHAMRYIHRTDPADLDRVVRYCERALELDPDLGEPYPWLSYAYMRQGKTQDAIRAGKHGVDRQPDLVIAHYFLGAAYLAASEHDQAAWQLAVTHLLDATITDTRWSASWLGLAQLAIGCGEYDHAEKFLSIGLEREKQGFGFGYFIGFRTLLGTVAQRRGQNEKAHEFYAAATAALEAYDHVYKEAFLALTACGLGDLLLREGRLQQALNEFRRASRLVKEFPRMLGRQRVSARALVGLATVNAAQGEAARAREFLDEAVQLVDEVERSPQQWLWEGALSQIYYGFAVAQMRLRNTDAALDCLSAASRSGWRDAQWLMNDPELTALHSQPRFQQLRHEVVSLPALEFQPSQSLIPA